MLSYILLADGFLTDDAVRFGFVAVITGQAGVDACPINAFQHIAPPNVFYIILFAPFITDKDVALQPAEIRLNTVVERD